MKVEAKTNCPLNSFEPCKQLDCAWFMKVRGTNPNTGEEVDEWGCAMTWMPVMLIENSRQQRSTAAAIESFRNEMTSANNQTQNILMLAAGVQPVHPALKDVS